MDILNDIPPRRFAEVDDLLAFISIYDDENRTQAYLSLLRSHRHWIQGAVCVDAGCGFGIFSREMARLGARKIYAVEANPLLVEIARSRLKPFPNITVVHEPIEQFEPPEPVDVMVHEFFGQLLYDEDVHVLQQLRFSPRLWLPNRARLAGGVMDATQRIDQTVTMDVLQHLNGVLVSGLFEDVDVPLSFTVLEWQPTKFQYAVEYDIGREEGDLLYLGLEIYQDQKRVCRAGECSNWSYVWTPRVGDRFRLAFQPADRGMRVVFEWLH
ncbi:MAG: class I SAM-dependent methyltransferase [Calditrichaeota bacterium]|nr:class I SAM-dependent methyltransferase [Calditrichota bacterium]